MQIYCMLNFREPGISLQNDIGYHTSTIVSGSCAVSAYRDGVCACSFP